jgi:predicted AlkP superfamily pyrophosphatase or phosphodiesterase
MMKPKRIEAVLRAVFTLTLFFAMVWPTLAQEKTAPLLVVISVDGLRPDYVTAADAHGAKVPHLRKFLHEGTYAQGVTGVIPTVTYPSHTTLMTGEAWNPGEPDV